MVVFNDLDPIEKIKVYDRGVSTREDLVGTDLVPLAYRRTGDVWLPQFDLTEALRVEAQHFLRCIVEGERAETGGEEALKVIQILEAAEVSLKKAGAAVSIDEGVVVL